MKMVLSALKKTKRDSLDTAGNRGVSRDGKTIRYRKTDKLSDKLTLTTDRNKTTLGTGVNRTVNKETGEVSYGANAKASYTALSQGEVQ